MKELAGKRFGRLVVVEYAGRNAKQTRHMWRCICDCGKESVVQSDNLLNGHTTSCGCRMRETGKNNRKDVTGLRFGRLVAISDKPSRSGKHIWTCVCDCGAVTTAPVDHLTSGHTRSCGCLAADLHHKHGLSKTREFRIWCHMRQRCEDPKNAYYSRYGGRGITVCARWREFKNFIDDMGFAPSTQHSINRVDNDGNYEPGNCVWSTPAEQNRNMSRNKWLDIDGVVKCAADWADDVGIDRRVVYKRLKDGWTAPQALGLEKRDRRCAHGSVA